MTALSYLTRNIDVRRHCIVSYGKFENSKVNIFFYLLTLKSPNFESGKYVRLMLRLGYAQNSSYLMRNSSWRFFLLIKLFFFLSLSYWVGSVQYVFHQVVIKIRQLFWRSAARLTSTLLETEVGILTTANAAEFNSLACLPKGGGARKNIFCTPILCLTFTNIA
jgi:hypothetical protein